MCDFSQTSFRDGPAKSLAEIKTGSGYNQVDVVI